MNKFDAIISILCKSNYSMRSFYIHRVIIIDLASVLFNYML